MQMTDSHKSVYAHAQNWLGRWFEQDCFFDGRDWRIMDTVFFGMFEIATTSMTVHVLSGEPGTAKSMRMKRLAASMSDGLVQQGGNKSARAGMQGARLIAIFTRKSTSQFILSGRQLLSHTCTHALPSPSLRK